MLVKQLTYAWAHSVAQLHGAAGACDSQLLMCASLPSPYPLHACLPGTTCRPACGERSGGHAPQGRYMQV